MSGAGFHFLNHRWTQRNTDFSDNGGGVELEQEETEGTDVVRPILSFLLFKSHLCSSVSICG